MTMNNAAFGELTFSTGWKTHTDITLFGKEYDVVVKARAYFEKEDVTVQQETAYVNFKNNKTAYLRMIEDLLKNYAGENATGRFKVRRLLFNRDGSYALLLDDMEDEDGGIAVCIKPQMKIVSQDEYL